MSERKQGYLWITLGYFERYKNTKTLDETRKDKDSLMRAIRRYCSRHNIKYSIYGCVASVHISKNKGMVEWVDNGLIEKQGFMDSNKCPLHLHIVVWTSARRTVKDFILAWWREHGYGIERYNALSHDSSRKKEGCMDCAEFEQEGHEQDLKNIVRYVKRNYKYSFDRCWIKANVSDSRDLYRIVYDM